MIFLIMLNLLAQSMPNISPPDIMSLTSRISKKIGCTSFTYYVPDRAIASLVMRQLPQHNPCSSTWAGTLNKPNNSIITENLYRYVLP